MRASTSCRARNSHGSGHLGTRAASGQAPPAPPAARRGRHGRRRGPRGRGRRLPAPRGSRSPGLPQRAGLPPSGCPCAPRAGQAALRSPLPADDPRHPVDRRPASMPRLLNHDDRPWRPRPPPGRRAPLRGREQRPARARRPGEQAAGPCHQVGIEHGTTRQPRDPQLQERDGERPRARVLGPDRRCGCERTLGGQQVASCQGHGRPEQRFCGLHLAVAPPPRAAPRRQCPPSPGDAIGPHQDRRHARPVLRGHTELDRRTRRAVVGEPPDDPLKCGGHPGRLVHRAGLGPRPAGADDR